jgi:hypothetical protein
MPLYKIEVYIDENYLKTVMVDAESQYEAEDQVRDGLNIDLDSELADV